MISGSVPVSKRPCGMDCQACSSSSSAFASLRSSVSNPSVNQQYTGAVIGSGKLTRPAPWI